MLWVQQEMKKTEEMIQPLVDKLRWSLKNICTALGVLYPKGYKFRSGRDDGLGDSGNAIGDSWSGNWSDSYVRNSGLHRDYYR